MVAQVITGEALDYSQPDGMLPYDKNCVAMTFSRLLGVGVYPTINFLIRKGWITRASDLENDTTINKVIEKLALAARYADTPWETVKVGMQGMQDGRYYATNWGPSGSSGGRGHAFAIVKKGGIGVYGNNQEVKQSESSPSRPYHQSIHATHKISVYGPIL
ncbi:hypothetical protein IHE49_03580 [Rhodanobacter sp. 7MK24]|uniref:hypothetical protein n=1 Tax=Rhodanobacter sp. 7MK24 TaxID=2775922 RepID=UPI00177CEFBE|nr:hypothetical protein [Rhodanobacter sp. 7MK24]MBD8879558.1 hypothetical protein [Rhodanobacter sp. 7MK24]